MILAIKTDRKFNIWCPVVVTFNSCAHQIFTPDYGGPTSKSYYKTLDFLITEIKRA